MNEKQFRAYIQKAEKKHKAAIDYSEYSIAVDFSEEEKYYFDFELYSGSQYTCSCIELGRFNTHYVDDTFTGKYGRIWDQIFNNWISYLRTEYRINSKNYMAHTARYQKTAQKFLTKLGFTKVCTYNGSDDYVTRWNGYIPKKRKNSKKKKIQIRK
jgi:hypothetical protein